MLSTSGYGGSITLVLSAIWLGLGVLASAAISTVVAVAALIWNARDDSVPRDSGSQRDHLDPVVRRLEREGIDRLTTGGCGSQCRPN
jgi:flagellar biosynthesis/type III secretory pathway M-ring protein FliF/YscJ